MKDIEQKTVITIETFQRTVMRSRRKANIPRCEHCAAEIVMLSADEAVGKANCSEISLQDELTGTDFIARPQ